MSDGASTRARTGAMRSPLEAPNAAALPKALAGRPRRAAAIESLIASFPEGSAQAKAGYAFVSDFPTQTIFVFDASG